jgi:serine/threonine-protein kinase
MARADADRNLLFGILAVHNGFVSRDALIRAMSAWLAEKETPLGQILARQGDLAPDQQFVMDALIKAHLKRHNDDPAQSLADLKTVSLVRVLHDSGPDADVWSTLAPSLCPEAGLLPAEDRAGVGDPTSSGRRFRIVRAHAEGGLGTVFLARDEELNREVALKQIKEIFSADRDSRTRFVAEAEITGGLEHPGVVPVYGLGCDETGRPYYAMRFIKGETLKEAIDRYHRSAEPERETVEHALELRRLLGRFIDVCESIGYAHSRGVIHRDLKPANVMLGKYGETLVVDWGLAETVGREQEAAVVTADEPTLRPSSGCDAVKSMPG